MSETTKQTVEHKTVRIKGDELLVAFMDNDNRKCSSLKIWESADEMTKGIPPKVEINFSSIFKMQLFWLLNLQCFMTVFRRLTGYSALDQNAQKHEGH